MIVENSTKKDCGKLKKMSKSEKIILATFLISVFILVIDCYIKKLFEVSNIYNNITDLQIIGVILAFILTAGVLFINDIAKSELHRKVIIRHILNYKLFSRSILYILISFVIKDISFIVIQILALMLTLIGFYNIYKISKDLYKWLDDKPAMLESGKIILSFRTCKFRALLKDDANLLNSFLKEDPKIDNLDTIEIYNAILSGIVCELQQMADGKHHFLKNVDLLVRSLKEREKKESNGNYLDYKNHTKGVIGWLMENCDSANISVEEEIGGSLNVSTSALKLFKFLYPYSNFDVFEYCLNYAHINNLKVPCDIEHLIEKFFQKKFESFSEAKNVGWHSRNDSNFSEKWLVTYENISKTERTLDAIMTTYTLKYVYNYLTIELIKYNTTEQINFQNDKILSYFFPEVDPRIFGKLWWIIYFFIKPKNIYKGREIEYLFWLDNAVIGLIDWGEGISFSAQRYNEKTYKCHLQKREDMAIETFVAIIRKLCPCEITSSKIDEIIAELQSYEEENPPEETLENIKFYNDFQEAKKNKKRNIVLLERLKDAMN